MTKKEILYKDKDVSIGRLGKCGIGPTSLDKLEAFGITTLYDMCIRGSEEIVEITALKEDIVKKAVRAAATILAEDGLCSSPDMQPKELKEYKNNLPKIKTNTDIDELLKGGVEPESIVEVYGAFRSGKTQFCYTLVAEAAKQHDINSYWIDCEGTFDSDRLEQIATARDYPDILDKVLLARTPNTDMIMEKIENLTRTIMDKKLGLIVIDGAIGQFREEFLGRGHLSVRQNNLARFMNILENTSYFLGIPIVFTNQVQADPAALPGTDPIRPIGGNIVGHAGTYRIYFKRRSDEKHSAKMVDSPKQGVIEALFTVDESGVVNLKA